MTDGEVAAALADIQNEIRVHDLDKAIRAGNAWMAGDIVLTHTLVSDIAWGYWLSDETPPADVYPLQDELAARRRAARGAVGRPHDLMPPSRYGHLLG
jgi:hypothetical protein